MENKFNSAKLNLFIIIAIAASILLTGCVNSIPFVPDQAVINKIFGAPPPVVEKRIETLAKDGYKQIVAFSR